ncbi:septum formation protein [Bryocella elongata]|uniref:dTTP/UTP pyrophosphatase n=1 Tax=Bryocella elongata TaxID=863522 RepID=A0A1H5Y4I2_9BACT|nr:Maf family protein [Bryocella elongata]SEG18705.1 septum formation protein [Bryocella elongata]
MNSLGRPLILASGSPRRRELLGQAGYEFTVKAADIDESIRAGEEPEEYVRRLALEKAKGVAAGAPEATVIGSDTTVVLDGEILGKPADVTEAAGMLERLSGRVHQVHTGVAVVVQGGARAVSHVETTHVTFNLIPTAELERYLATGDSLDKAGAYGIQGYAARWIPRIDGCYFNVMGLPVAATVRLLGQMER